MKIIAFDIETSGKLEEYALQPARALTGDAWLTSYAWAERGKDGEIRAHGTLNPDAAEIGALLDMAAAHGWYVVCWNTPFDVAWLHALGLTEDVRRVKWLDAMLLWKHLTAMPDFATADGKRASYGLKAAVAKFLPEHTGYEKDVAFHDTSEASRALLLQYNKLDARLTLELAERFLSEMPLTMRRNALIEARSLSPVAETYVHGLRINAEAANALDAKLEKLANVTLTTLKLQNPEVTEEVLASPSQLSDLLYNTWGLPVQKQTAKGANSTDKDALSELGRVDERAKLVRDYREANNLRTKFVQGPLESITYNGDGVTRPQARIYGTYTGRMTYSSKQGRGKQERPTGVALHQWKRQADFRRLIQPPEGYTLLEFDFAGQEFRWMAVLSGDQTMLTLCQPGEDAHGYMGGRIARIEYSDMLRRLKEGDKEAKAKRQLGKVANLSLQYRTSAKTLMIRARTDYGLDLDLPSAQAIHATYQLTYRGVPDYWTRQVINGMHHGCVATPAGRHVFLDSSTRWPPALKWSYESTTINFPIQGAGADQKYLALAVIQDYLNKCDGRFYFELHDGLFFVVPHAKAERAARDIRRILSNLPYEKAWGIKLPIQFPVDAKIGPSWGDLKEFADE